MTQIGIALALGEKSRLDQAELRRDLDDRLTDYNLYISRIDGELDAIALADEIQKTTGYANLWVGAQGADVYIVSQTSNKSYKILPHVGSEALQIIDLILQHLEIGNN